MTNKTYAFIKNGEVVNIALFDNPTQELLNIFIEDHNVDSIIEATPFTCVGGTYDGEKFWRPQPYPSWTKDEENNWWIPPVPYPTVDPENPKSYEWNEELLNWEEVSE